ncbi:MAG: HAD family phosphatase, partial [Chitinophagia bacterium]|nr:HAD family phosphatase [Chitinophagia bacterium]
DNLRNINAAKEVGIISIHFQSPDQLRNELKEKKIID